MIIDEVMKVWGCKRALAQILIRKYGVKREMLRVGAHAHPYCVYDNADVLRVKELYNFRRAAGRPKGSKNGTGIYTKNKVNENEQVK